MRKERHEGKIVLLNKERGFGFIEDNDGSGKIFLHFSELNGMNGIVAIGDDVSYDIDVD